MMTSLACSWGKWSAHDRTSSSLDFEEDSEYRVKGELEGSFAGLGCETRRLNEDRRSWKVQRELGEMASQEKVLRSRRKEAEVEGRSREKREKSMSSTDLGERVQQVGRRRANRSFLMKKDRHRRKDLSSGRKRTEIQFFERRSERPGATSRKAPELEVPLLLFPLSHQDLSERSPTMATPLLDSIPDPNPFPRHVCLPLARLLRALAPLQHGHPPLQLSPHLSVSPPLPLRSPPCKGLRDRALVDVGCHAVFL